MNKKQIEDKLIKLEKRIEELESKDFKNTRLESNPDLSDWDNPQTPNIPVLKDSRYMG